MSEDLEKPIELNYQITIHNNKQAQFITNDLAILKKLKNKLSFKPVGVEYTPAYQNGWSGITYLLDAKGGFPLGLLNKVEKFCKANKIKYSLSDKRKIVESFEPIDLTDKLKTFNLIPRDYQKKVVDTALANRKGIIRVATGGGKSICSVLITAALNKPTIIYVIGLDLLKQFHDLFSKLFDEKIGFIGNGVCDIQRINIASIWTIGSALKLKNIIEDEEGLEKELPPNQEQSKKILQMLSQTKVHQFDESHTIVTTTIKQIFNKIDPEYIYGFSGTPFRDDGCDLLINAILGEKIIDIPASELIEGGFLAQPIIKFVKVPKTYIGTGSSNYHTVYKEYIVENNIRNSLIVEQTKQLLTKNYQVLVLFKNLSHGENLRTLFDDHNIPYEYLAGADDLETRQVVKDKLLSGKSNLVLASTIYDIGVDVPSLSALVLSGGGKSSIRTLQRVGRVIRKHQGKKFAAIVDFYDDVRYLKNHSKKRFQIYNGEPGFKIIVSKGIKELK